MVKRLTVLRTPTSKWVACFSVDQEDKHNPPWKDGSLVGIDMGLESFATLSNGQKIANPRFLLEEEHQLARVQRKLSKAPKGTAEMKKALKAVQRIHERIANKRNKFVHQVSHNLVDRFGLIAFEDLNIKGIAHNPARQKGSQMQLGECF